MQIVRASSFLEAAVRASGGPPIVLGLDVDASRLIKALQTPDAVGAIIRIHKDLSRELERVVRFMVLKAGRPKPGGVSQWISCLEKAGLPGQRLTAARKINSVRNAFAHREKELFDEVDVDELSKAVGLVLGDDYGQTALHDLTTDPYGRWDYEKMDHKGKFSLFAVTAIALVASIKNEFERHSFKPRFPRLLRVDQIREATKPHTLLLFIKPD